MAASDHIHPQQLKMFMTPREIKDQYSSHIGDRQIPQEPRFMPDRDVWPKKSREAAAEGLTESVAEEGVHHPIGLGTKTDTEVARGAHLHPDVETTDKPMLTGGHHRLQAAEEADPERLVPVLHWRDILEHKGMDVPESHYEHKGIMVNGVERKINLGIARPWGRYR